MMMIIRLFMLPLVTYTEGKSGQIIALRIHSVYVHEVASYHQMMEEGRGCKANLIWVRKIFFVESSSVDVMEMTSG